MSALWDMRRLQSNQSNPVRGVYKYSSQQVCSQGGIHTQTLSLFILSWACGAFPLWDSRTLSRQRVKLPSANRTCNIWQGYSISLYSIVMYGAKSIEKSWQHMAGFVFCCGICKVIKRTSVLLIHLWLRLLPTGIASLLQLFFRTYPFRSMETHRITGYPQEGNQLGRNSKSPPKGQKEKPTTEI